MLSKKQFSKQRFPSAAAGVRGKHPTSTGRASEHLLFGDESLSQYAQGRGVAAGFSEEQRGSRVEFTHMAAACQKPPQKSPNSSKCEHLSKAILSASVLFP